MFLQTRRVYFTYSYIHIQIKRNVCIRPELLKHISRIYWQHSTDSSVVLFYVSQLHLEIKSRPTRTDQSDNNICCCSVTLFCLSISNSQPQLLVSSVKRKLYKLQALLGLNKHMHIGLWHIHSPIHV